MDILVQLFSDYTLRMVTLGATVLGVVSGALGTFAVLRGQSLVGDAVSHAALPGIALAFLLTGFKAPLVLMLGAAAAGLLATTFVLAIVRTTRIKFDSALGMTLAVFFGVGLVLLTHIQRMPTANQAGLDTFLFGQAAALVSRDVVTMASVGGVVLVLVALFWKEFKLLSFDADFGRAQGFPMARIDLLLTTLLVLAIVIGLQTVGVVLMSAMIVAPAAAARQWTDRLGAMLLLAAVFGAVSGVSGALISASTARLPTGPTIVLCVSFIVVISLTLAPNRGIVWRRARAYARSRRLRMDAVLLDLFELAGHHADRTHAHGEAALSAMSGQMHPRHALRALEARGLVRREGADAWGLSPAGVRHAEELTRRLTDSSGRSRIADQEREP